jgi:hypothetical protein
MPDRKSETGRSNIPSLQTRYARQVGHLALAYYLDRAFRGDEGIKGNDGLKMFNRFMESGGFRVFLESRRGARGFSSRARDADKKLNCVYKMMLYLCRYNKHINDRSKLTLEYAEHFLFEESKLFTVKTIEHIWLNNKQAAPYIFAFHPTFSPVVAQVNTIGELVDALEPIAKNQSRISKLLGAAAHAADVLVGMKVRDVRKSDFREVTQVEPQLADFSDDEMQIINRLDPDRLSDKDAADWIPPKRRKPVSNERQRHQELK